MSKYDEVMDIICHTARYKMVVNSHKGSIEQIDHKKAVELAAKEMQEAMEAWEKGDWEKVMVELGDVMNFMVSIGHNALENYRRRK